VRAKVNVQVPHVQTIDIVYTLFGSKVIVYVQAHTKACVVTQSVLYQKLQAQLAQITSFP